MLAPADVEALVTEADGPRVLVNNAGGWLGHIAPHFPDATPGAVGRHARPQPALGAMLATQLALEPMRRAGGGAIVNIASTAGLGSEPYESPEYARREGRAASGSRRRSAAPRAYTACA